MRYETGQHSVGGGVLWSYMAIRHTPPTQNWERSFPHGSVSVKQIWAPWALLVVRPKFTICGEAGRGRGGAQEGGEAEAVTPWGVKHGKEVRQRQ